ncbi:Rha family transcriptional regulator [Lysinibacillus capsici]|uniref:Rha family transcriptional regulator n=1 Tax=Lysinibacillus capsici TaxID=2115968 RepID=UPI0028A15677|nr:Rha family transcriptional regulator [Lysinibacillus capsici]
MNQLQRNISSLEVAEMVSRPHNDVLKDIRRIIDQLGEGTSSQSYFIESTYTNTQNKELPCFLLSKKGCELYGTRMTGEKGTQFAVKYIERFNEMEEQQKVNFTMPQPTTAELIAMMAQQGVEQERRLNAMEEKQLQLETKQDNIAEIVALNPTEWRKKTTTILNKIALARGGFEEYRKVRNESYQVLDERARCKLDIRLTNRKKEMALNGATKAKIDKVSKLDVIADDARLTEIYLAIVKEMAIKHQIKVEGLGA